MATTRKTPTPRKRKTGGSTANPPADLFVRLCRKTLGVECVREYRFHTERKWRFDYAIPAHRIALEVEGGVWTGGRHTSSQGFLGDMEKYNTATVMGWRVLRTTPENLVRNDTIEMLRAAIQSGSEVGKPTEAEGKETDRDGAEG